MNLQEKIFAEVTCLMDSGEPKMKFLADKDFSEAKFNYWLAKWKAGQFVEDCVAFPLFRK